MEKSHSSDRRAVEVKNPHGRAPVVIVCEHASNHIPEDFSDLGLTKADRLSHAVWDPGAEKLAMSMTEILDAPAVLGQVSRLVHDCNRPAGSPEACPDRVERINIPGNKALSPSDRGARARAVYFPFHEAVDHMLAKKGPATTLLTVHSFSPTWHHAQRSTEIGLLHDADAQLAETMFGLASGSHRVELNQPYSAADGVTHSLIVHTDKAQSSVMIEVRNDLLETDDSVSEISQALSSMLVEALNKKVVTA